MIQILPVNIHQLHAQHTTSVHQIIHAWEIFANQIVTTIKIVWPMNDVYEERVAQYVTTMPLVEMDKFAKIDYVKSVAAMI